MKKIFFLLVAVCTFFACDPTHEDISNGGHITVQELMSKTTITADKADNGQWGNVITCTTSAPVNAAWNIGGKDFIGNYATRKMKVNRGEDGNYTDTKYTVYINALCADGTMLVDSVIVTCQTITNELQKIYIYGGDPEKEPPFSPAAWDGAEMRFSSTEGRHLPTIPDDVYFGLKTLIVDVSDASADCNLMVHNGWWSNTYISDWPIKSGLNELQITETIAKECAKGGEGRDLQLLLKSGSFTLNSVYYEE